MKMSERNKLLIGLQNELRDVIEGKVHMYVEHGGIILSPDEIVNALKMVILSYTPPRKE